MDISYESHFSEEHITSAIINPNTYYLKNQERSPEKSSRLNVRAQLGRAQSVVDSDRVCLEKGRAGDPGSSTDWRSLSHVYLCEQSTGHGTRSGELKLLRADGAGQPWPSAGGQGRLATPARAVAERGGQDPLRRLETIRIPSPGSRLPRPVPRIGASQSRMPPPGGIFVDLLPSDATGMSGRDRPERRPPCSTWGRVGDWPLSWKPEFHEGGSSEAAAE